MSLWHHSSWSEEKAFYFHQLAVPRQVTHGKYQNPHCRQTLCVLPCGLWFVQRKPSHHSSSVAEVSVLMSLLLASTPTLLPATKEPLLKTDALNQWFFNISVLQVCYDPDFWVPPPVPKVADSRGLEWSLRTRIVNKLPSDADEVAMWTTVWASLV